MSRTTFSGPVNSTGGFEIANVAITATAAQINVLTGVTAGTVTASKALVVDANKDLASLRNLTLTGTATLSGVVVDTGVKTATAVAGAATLNKLQGAVTSEALTTAANGIYTLTLTNSTIAAADMVIATAQNGTNTTEGLSIERIQPAAGSCVFILRNTAAAALNGTVVIKFLTIKA